MTVSNQDLKEMVENYLTKLEYTRPLVNSDKFIDNSYSKWACRELLKTIRDIRRAPFDMTAIEILNHFIDKMKQYAWMNQKNSLLFTIASEVGEYFLEECYLSQWNKRK